MSSRLDYTIKNARWTMLFSVVLLVINFFSRSVFIDYLGSEFIGLASVITSYIGFLNLAELGIGLAITQALYKPVYEDDKDKISDIVSLIGYLFKWVGLSITFGALVLGCFLPTIFESSGIGVVEIYATFVAMLFTTLLSYFVNYKQTIVIATQRSYVITKIQNTTLVAKVCLQMAAVMLLSNGYIYWLALEMIFGVVYAIWLELYIKRNFKWLHSSIKTGKQVAKSEKAIFKNVRNIFSQRIASMILLQSDNIVIQNVISVVQVTYFTNYTMLIQRVTQLIINTLGNAYASIGNLIHSNDDKKLRLVYWQFNALFFWIGGIIAFSFFELINPFIDLWLKDKELYSMPIVGLLAFNLFIGIIRRPNDFFLNGYGLYSDVWAAWSEMGLNLAISIVLGLKFGIIGVVAGTAISTGLAVLIWKPYYLYSRGFKSKCGALSLYWGSLLKYIAIILGVSIGVHALGGAILVDVQSWWTLIIRALVLCAIFVVTTYIILYATSTGMRTLTKLALDVITKKRQA